MLVALCLCLLPMAIAVSSSWAEKADMPAPTSAPAAGAVDGTAWSCRMVGQRRGTKEGSWLIAGFRIEGGAERARKRLNCVRFSAAFNSTPLRSNACTPADAPGITQRVSATGRGQPSRAFCPARVETTFGGCRLALTAFLHWGRRS
jgi:hypothetical protein